MSVKLLVSEIAGHVGADGKLSVEETLPIQGPVRVWVMAQPDQEEIREQSWLTSLANNPAFADLRDSSQDVYTLNDGKPFQD